MKNKRAANLLVPAYQFLNDMHDILEEYGNEYAVAVPFEASDGTVKVLHIMIESPEDGPMPSFH
jgi:hypothetical protein